MEDKNLQRFFSDLDSILENGWIHSIFSSRHIPNGWGTSVFTSRAIVLSFNHVLLYSIKHCDKEAFKRVIKHLADIEFIDVWPIYKEGVLNREYGLKQLEPNQIFEALSVLDSKNSDVLLNQINCTVGAYTELKNALAKKDKDRFFNAISECNTSCINLVLANILFLLKSESYYELYKNNHSGCCDSGKHASNKGKKKSDKSVSAIGDELLKGLTNPAVMAGMAAMAYVALESLRKGPRRSNKYIPSDDELLDSVYYSYFFQYCRLKDEYALDTKAEHAFNYIFQLPAVKEKYNEGMEYWKNNRWEEKLKEYGLIIRNLLYVEHAAVIDSSQSMSQVEEPQTSITPDEIVAQKKAERKRKEENAFNLINELLTNTAGEKDFFKDGFNLEQLIKFFKIILAKESVLEAVTKTDKRIIYVYKGIVLEKFCNIIGYLISKGVISESQKEVAEALFGMEETKTAIFNWKPVDKNSREAVDRKVNIFTTLSSYISNGVNDNSKSFINPKIREWFDEVLDSVRQSQ